MRYQYDFAAKHPYEMYSIESREQKANKVIAVLKDYLGDLKKLRCLDIGCSRGIMTSVYNEHFKEVIGIDIDKDAIWHAKNSYKGIKFYLMDSMKTKFKDNSFDVITCTQIYEHVPDARLLMKEVYRLLKPNGVCFFSANNRMRLMEVRYKLPFLSIIPKWLGHSYLRIMGKGDYYYETHYTLNGLRNLVRRFKVVDYTKKVLYNPDKYFIDDMVSKNSFKHKLIKFFLRHFYYFFPTYIWVLKKNV